MFLVVTWKDGVTNAEVLSLTGQMRLQNVIGERRFWFVGHILQIAPEHLAHSAMDWTLADGRRRRGRPKKSWQSTFLDHLQARRISGVRWR